MPRNSDHLTLPQSTLQSCFYTQGVDLAKSLLHPIHLPEFIFTTSLTMPSLKHFGDSSNSHLPGSDPCGILYAGPAYLCSQLHLEKHTVHNSHQQGRVFAQSEITLTQAPSFACQPPHNAHSTITVLQDMWLPGQTKTQFVLQSHLTFA